MNANELATTIEQIPCKSQKASGCANRFEYAAYHAGFGEARKAAAELVLKHGVNEGRPDWAAELRDLIAEQRKVFHTGNFTAASPLERKIEQALWRHRDELIAAVLGIAKAEGTTHEIDSGTQSDCDRRPGGSETSECA